MTKPKPSLAASWYRALTLTERFTSQRSPEFQPGIIDHWDLAERRLQRWRSQPPFTTVASFHQRLAADGLTEADFIHLLGEPAETIRERFPAPPEWLVQIETAFSLPSSAALNMLQEKLSSEPMAEALAAIEPLIDQARQDLNKSIQKLVRAQVNLPFDPDTIDDVLFANLPGQLIRQMSRTMVLELNVARLQGLLQGEGSNERYQNFVDHLRNREVTLAILEEYPVLARQLVQCIFQWKSTSLDFLQRLCRDAEILNKMFCPGRELGLLVELDGGAGDRHRGGQSVLIAGFSSAVRLVYKPRSLAVDQHFQELLTWLNQRGDHPHFPTLNILDRDSYGWVEFVTAHGCTTPEQVERFYERQGGYLALLYAIEATDFHNENILAAGEDPFLLDLEAIFHPHVDGLDPRHAEDAAASALFYSVLGVGLLPERIFTNASGEGVDISGLGGAAGQVTPHHVARWEQAGTDQMRLTRKRVLLAGANNRPSLNGADIAVLAYTESIVKGFIKIYRLLLEHRIDLLSPDGPLARFSKDEVRVILRPTRTYAMLLRESFHPDVLRDAIERDRLLDRLWQAVEQQPYLAAVIPAEREAILNGDIPLFASQPGSRDLWSSSGKRIANFSDRSGLALAYQRVQQLSEPDLARQIWLIRASLATLAAGGDQSSFRKYSLTDPQSAITPERLIALACAVGNRLGELALHGEEDVSWIGLSFADQRQWTLVPLGSDFYDGLPGIILFLAYLGTTTKEPNYTSQAQAALATLKRQLERNPAGIKSVGGFTGWGGIIYLLTHLGVLWNRAELLAEVGVILERLPGLISQDEQFDIISGSAGCIASLSGLYGCTSSRQALETAILCGDHLIAGAETMEQGIGWRTGIHKGKPLAGFSHGSAGIALALLQLAALTGEERFRTTALEAIRYERSLYSTEAGNWFDLRDLNHQETRPEVDIKPKFMTSWCHGAPGIGLARLNSLPYLDDEIIRSEIQTAIQTTLTYGVGHNHTLCHGDLGNLEFLLQASKALEDPMLPGQVNHLASIIFESIQRDGPICANSLSLESPGMMTGLAGIGYGLLRLSDPSHIPSLLVLAPAVLTAANMNELFTAMLPQSMTNQESKA